MTNASEANSAAKFARVDLVRPVIVRRVVVYGREDGDAANQASLTVRLEQADGTLVHECT